LGHRKNGALFDPPRAEVLTPDRLSAMVFGGFAIVASELHFHKKFLDFAAYYGFVPRVCRPYRPETKGKIESTIGFW
jgi:transposase